MDLNFGLNIFCDGHYAGNANLVEVVGHEEISKALDSLNRWASIVEDDKLIYLISMLKEEDNEDSRS